MKDWYRDLAEIKAMTTLSVTKIAHELHKSRETVSRTLKKSEVQDLIRDIYERKSHALEGNITERADRIASKAWDRLESIIDDDDAPDAAQVSAAVAILKGTGQLVERTQEQQNHLHLHGVVAVPQEVPLEQWDSYLEEQGLISEK